jgi:hypothetical protein
MADWCQHSNGANRASSSDALKVLWQGVLRGAQGSLFLDEARGGHLPGYFVSFEYLPGVFFLNPTLLVLNSYLIPFLRHYERVLSPFPGLLYLPRFPSHLPAYFPPLNQSFGYTASFSPFTLYFQHLRRGFRAFTTSSSYISAFLRLFPYFPSHP